MQFLVVSASRPGDFYAIDLTRRRCNCPDFHQIEFCKHLAAVQAHFPHLWAAGNTEVTGSAQEPPQNLNQELHQENLNQEHSRRANLDILSKHIAGLSQTLVSQPTTQSDITSAILEAYRSVVYTITAAIASTQGTSALPDKENIPPNQKTWQEMAEHMGTWRLGP